MTATLALLPVGDPGPRGVPCSAPGCGRWLTDPASVRDLMGPVCWAKVHPRRPRVRRRAVMAAAAPRRPGPVDGQLALDLPVQPALAGLP